MSLSPTSVVTSYFYTNTLVVLFKYLLFISYKFNDIFF